MWERALRRARLPLAYTEGFSPRPRLSFGLALPTGCESEAEYLDVVLDADRAGPEGVAVTSLPAVLTPLLPDGIVVREAAPLTPGRGSLQELVTSCSLTVDVAGVTRDGLAAKVATFLQAPSVLLVRERKGRSVEDDVRPPSCPSSWSTPGIGRALDTGRRHGSPGDRAGHVVAGHPAARIASGCGRLRPDVARDGSRNERAGPWIHHRNPGPRPGL